MSRKNAVEEIAEDDIETGKASFSKGVFLKSQQYKADRDLLNVLLKNEKSYTKAEVNKMIDSYKKGKVK